MENSIKGDAGKTGKRSGLKRTSLYASASSPVNMIQAAFYEEDCLVYDLEDSVSAAEKDSADSWYAMRCVTTGLKTSMWWFASTAFILSI